MRKFKVRAADVGQRADVFVASKYPEFTRSSLERLFNDSLVEVADKKAKASQKLRLSDQVEVDDSLLKAQPDAIELPILYEDVDVVVINKPAGVLTHSKGALNTEATVASFLTDKITDKNLAGNRAGIVHRLDRPTSGVIIGAKSEKAQRYLQKQFASRKTNKTYVAVVEGIPEPPEAIIDAPIARNPKKPRTFRVDRAGKTAQTHYKVVKRLENKGRFYSGLELKPITGRTHQLRVHLAYINHPIVGDQAYGREGGPMLLHAKSLELTLPNGQKVLFEAPLPAYFKDFWTK